MSDVGLTAIDNTRFLAAHEAGIDVQATIHEFDDALPEEFTGRFSTPKGGAPSSWGDAIMNRIGGRARSGALGIRWVLNSQDGMETDMADLLRTTDLPKGFEYPPEFIRVVELGLQRLEPWWIIDGGLLRDRYTSLRKRYEKRSLVPFATRQDNDDVACWDLDAGNVAVVHDFASPGFEQRGEFRDFYEWLRQAIEDLITFQ